MDDGYWTPFHLAADDLRASEVSASRGWQMADELHLTVRDLTLRAEKAERDLDKIRQCIAGFVEVVEAAEAHATGPKGGQQVTFSGDFASVPPSVRGRLRWWSLLLSQSTQEEL
jgi:hypothetical protein